MTEALYEIETLDETIQAGALQFQYRIKRNFENTYNHPVRKLEDGSYETKEITLPAGSTVMLFENLETAEVSLSLLNSDTPPFV